MEGRHRAEPKPTGDKLDAAAQVALHDLEALTGASSLSDWRKRLAGEVPHVDLDTTRGVWRSWLDVLDEEGEKIDPGYERAKVRGEWTTRWGAIRRMRNFVPPTQERASTAAPPRPEPGGGSTSLFDDLATRREHVKRSGVGGTIKHYLSLAAYVLAIVMVTLFVVLGLWEGFIRKIVSPVRVAAPVVTVAPEPVVVPVEPVSEPAPSPPTPHTRASHRP